MSERFHTIVVGVGAMGSSACMHLARRGKRVLGLDQFDIPHSRGSSHGHSRMIRSCYYEHPDYVPLVRRAYELWRELERQTGQRLLHITGGVYMGPAGAEAVAGAARAAAAHGLEHEMLDRTAIARAYPQFHLPDDYGGLYEPEAGYLLPELVIAAQTGEALAAGCEIHGHERVVEWRSDGETVTVRTSRGEYSAQRLIITAGAWASKVAADLGARVFATRQVLGWVWPRRPELFRAGVMPVWAIDYPGETDADSPRAGLYYGFPMSAATGSPGFKIARHAPGSRIDPDLDDRDLWARDEEDFRPALRRFLPEADGPLLAMRVCMYENSPDSHFIIDRHPRWPNVVVAAGLSGHGFKFASVVGEVLADLAIEGATRHPIGFLGVQRFADRALA